MSSAPRVLGRVLLALVIVLIVAAVGGYWYARPLLLTGTGYAAHNDCAVRFVAGRDTSDQDLPPNPLVPYLRTYSDLARRTSESGIYGVLAGQKAFYTKGYGCTVGTGTPTLGEPTPVTSSGNPFTSLAPTPGPKKYAAAVATAMKAPGTRAIVVVKDGELVAEAYAPGFTETTPQLGWSMSKSVATLLTGRLVQAGTVSVKDDHLRPEWTDARADITIDQLMRMTSGLTWDETYELGTPITSMLYLDGDMAKSAASQPLAHTPGTVQLYSSGSTNILCKVLAERAGVSADLPRREIFEPLGLSSAVWEVDAVGTPVCSSYLWATPRDWAVIGQFALQGGAWNGQQLLPKTWMKDSLTLTPVTDSDEESYAAGWRTNSRPHGSLVSADIPKDAYWASGHDGQRLYIVPSQKLVVARLGFSPGATSDDLGVTTLVGALTKIG